MALNELLPKAVKLYAHQEAMVCGDVRLSYQDFGNRVWQLCHSLLDLGLKKGDRLAILHENCHVFLETYFACAHLGLILVSLNIRLSPQELGMILQDSQTDVMIAQAKFLDKVDALVSIAPNFKKVIWTQKLLKIAEMENLGYEDLLLEQGNTPPPELPLADDDIAHLYYTSGTTGRPKGVMLTHKNVKTHALGTIAELKLADRDRWIHAAPLFHLADAWAAFAVTWAGGRHIIIPSFDPMLVFEAIANEGGTITNLIPTMLNMMVNHPDVKNFDYSSLRVLLSGGAPIAPEVVRKIIETFNCDYIQTYGMTETSPYLTMSILKEHLKDLPWEEQLQFKASTGREFINVSLKVVDEKGRDIPKDREHTGEIIVKGDTVTPGYWNLPEETGKAIRDGWLYTGDLAVIDEEGYVTIVDRKKDMILTGGENVYSTEVENVLYMHPDVLEAAVIGVPDSHWGEAVKACVVLKPDGRATAEEVIAFCKQHLAHYKAPKSVDFLEALPQTGTGKIYKKALRDPYWEGKDKQVS
ncbi:MAG: long-chain-fatty-acid--CoA ligase [Deltaproteobacteria bacterium]|nr:long-chain-fatty-acid--CoA ligase [Deltaproteobacteria bacterium]MBW2051287.1 long-chain-fatty-acid--CoA ligase [Deltaproteobacteria bacterium]MBW2140446.1 long-chain-fatty-acid--CoA ligase [Deltaproteobacteria bacterium]MBW2323444.1 long-chain-fatty-acid--CoA ligase [Deltaproteobacteria bacterium]